MNKFLSDENLKKFILTLKIAPDQEKFLLDELPSMDEKSRIDLLQMLENVFVLNQEEAQAKKKIKEIMDS